MLSDTTEQTIVVIEENDEEQGQYLLEHDKYYLVGKCFHIKLYWFFARGTIMFEKVKTISRKIKEFGNDQFAII